MYYRDRKVPKELPLTAAVDVLNRLPTGFVGADNFPYKYYALVQNSKAHPLWKEAKKYSNLARMTGEQEDIQHAFETIDRAAEAYWEHEGPDQYGLCLVQKAKFALDVGEAFEANETILKAYHHYQQHDAPEALRLVYPILFQANVALLEAAEDLDHRPLQQIFTDRLKGYIKESRRYSLNLRQAKLSENAYIVSQGDVGFSGADPLGTLNIQDCVCLMVRDPSTHKTALAHIDKRVSKESLDIIFDNLPKLHAGTRYQARLIGARYYDGALGEGSFHQSSEQNLQAIIEKLHQYPVDILSAQLGEKDQAANIVVDPKDFSLHHARATIGEDRNDAVSAFLKTSRAARPLRIAFDLTKGEVFAPVKLDREDIVTYECYFKSKSFKGMVDFVQRLDPDHGVQTVGRVDDCLTLQKLVNERQEHFEGIVTSKLEALARRGYTISAEKRAEIYQEVQKCPKHIGPNADVADAPLVNLIEKGGLFQLLDRRRVHVRVSYLKKYDTVDQPYTTLEEKKYVGTKRQRLSALRKLLG